MAFITVSSLTKEYKIYKRPIGLTNSIKSIFERNYEYKRAVDNISFNIDKGEVVGYIGPNGAGKSTTLKMMAGILVPSGGMVEIDGYIPYKERKFNSKRIGVVYGQRSQLYWDLPMEETFQLYKKIYNIPEKLFKNNLEFFIDLLSMKEFIRTPVRQLSLGQRMRAEIVTSLLHDPDIVYLDEPTIGLDVIAKSKIRNFIKQVNKEKKTTIILTTHDMEDIEEICKRIITIDKGKVIFDGSINQFKNDFTNGHVLMIELKTDRPIFLNDQRLLIVKEEGKKKWISFQKESISVTEAIKNITELNEVIDISLKEPGIQEAVQKIYEHSMVRG